MLKRGVCLLLLSLSTVCWSHLTPVQGASHPPLRSKRGMVAADNAIASQVGADILAAGGNAVDAGIGTMAALGLTHPFGSGIGGGGFCLYRDGTTGDVKAYDFRETTPAAGHRDMYLDAKGNPQPERSVKGGLAVGIPGEVAGMEVMQNAHGRRSLAANLAPVVTLARQGYPASTLLEKRVARKQSEIEADPDWAAWLLPAGRPPEAGEVLRNPALAETLEAIGRDGAKAFYQGPRAELIVDAVQRRGGVMTLADLKGYSVKVREPVRGTFRGVEIISMPPPSSGGIAIIQTLNILEGLDFERDGHNASRTLHMLAEALKFAFADRAQYLGDPDFVKVPVGKLIDKKYAQTLRTKIQEGSVLPSEAYGPARYSKDDHGTSHFSVLDADGNMLACTTTINTSFGAKVYVGKAGVVLNNEMDDFIQKPGTPNSYGLIGTEANAVAPGKRPLSSMSPTLVLRDGQPFMVLGGSGGPLIITSTLQVMLNVLVFDKTVREAVEAPRIHHQWKPERLLVEGDIPHDVRRNLETRGHTIKVIGGWSAVQAIVAGAPYNTAASDPRKHGAPAAQDTPR